MSEPLRTIRGGAWNEWFPGYGWVPIRPPETTTNGVPVWDDPPAETLTRIRDAVMAVVAAEVEGTR